MKTVLPALASLLALALAGCGDSDEEPVAADSSETTEESTTPTETPSETPTETVTPSETPTSADSGPLVLEDGRIDLCSAISIDDLAAATGWTAVSSGEYIGDGSCEWEFAEAELNVAYDEYQTFDQWREQSANYKLVELDGVGDGAFLQVSPIAITPESVGLVLSSGEWVLLGGAIESDESVTEDELATAAEALVRACAAVL